MARTPTTTPAAREPRLLSTAQVARRLGVSVRLVRYWISEGKLRAVRLSERITRISEEDVDRLIAEAERVPATNPETA